MRPLTGIVHELDSPGNFRASFDSLKGRAYRLDRATDLAGGSWVGVLTSAVESLPWSSRTLSDTNPPAVSEFYRLIVEPWP